MQKIQEKAMWASKQRFIFEVTTCIFYCKKSNICTKMNVWMIYESWNNFFQKWFLWRDFKVIRYLEVVFLRLCQLYHSLAVIVGFVVVYHFLQKFSEIHKLILATHKHTVTGTQNGCLLHKPYWNRGILTGDKMS